jgi:hypothetical protein
MYCPECGSDAGEANFCPECGTDLRGLAGDEPDHGVCPECGTDAGDANYCPECGHRLVDAPPATRGARPTPPKRAALTPPADEGGSGKSRQQRRQADRRAAQKAARHPQASARPAAARGAGPQRPTTWLIWGGFAVAAVVVVLVIVGLGGGDSTGGGSAGAPSGGSSVPAVAADTTGSYSELVTRANGLYDQGSAAFQNNDATGGQKYFAAAAKVYAAAWKKQSDDPNVGTDFATALFYSGQTDEAIAQVDKVLEADPEFQTAHLNRGIFLKTAAQDATDAGDSAQAEKLLADAKASFEKAVSIDAGTDPGQRAAQELEQL